MQIVESLDYWFWIPVLFWAGLYFWYYRVSFPTFLKKQMRKGHKWAFVPAWKGYWIPLDIVLGLVASVASVIPVARNASRMLVFTRLDR